MTFNFESTKKESTTKTMLRFGFFYAGVVLGLSACCAAAEAAANAINGKK